MAILDDISDAIWTAGTRTLAGGSAAAPTNGQERVADAFWTNGTRTLTGEEVPDLIAGVASYVSRDADSIQVIATAPTGGSGSGPTYQWERSEDGGSYADVSGATSLSLDDDTVTTGVLYRYRCKQTRGSDTVTTNVVTKRLDSGDVGPFRTLSRIRSRSLLRGLRTLR